ncbi:SLATT domain-containing protein [Bisbaumannia pacifica]|uniref:SLATT domain-containing protein n=1 Tax=Bisbaumannia pacifica TaxID=77098 RepID=A0ABD4KZL2_9GAMM|nr:SLATT domain-containing protein [Halomonas pacifica]MBH8578748.1 SLATT domain-containing protein [Halomonas pacifica]
MDCAQSGVIAKTSNEAPIENIYRKIDITAETRFHAARRITHHSEWSMRLTVVISLALVLVSIMQILEMGRNIDSVFTSLFQVYGSILILIFSIISTMKNYTGTAEKFYACASELVELKRKIQPCKLARCSSRYDEISGSYNEILKRYETHTVKDFRSDHTRALSESKSYGEKDIGGRIKRWLSWRWGYFLNFSHYLVSIAILLPLFWLICFAELESYYFVGLLIY